MDPECDPFPSFLLCLSLSKLLEVLLAVALVCTLPEVLLAVALVCTLPEVLLAVALVCTLPEVLLAVALVHTLPEVLLVVAFVCTLPEVLRLSLPSRLGVSSIASLMRSPMSSLLMLARGGLLE